MGVLFIEQLSLTSIRTHGDRIPLLPHCRSRSAASPPPPAPPAARHRSAASAPLPCSPAICSARSPPSLCCRARPLPRLPIPPGASQKKGREKREKRREGEKRKKKKRQLTGDFHVLFLIFLLTRMSRQRNHQYILS
jgi:hypothetical protein